MPPKAMPSCGQELVAPEPLAPAPAGGHDSKKREAKDGKDAKDTKDPMDSIFGWRNFWLPDSMQLPPVVWAMIIFGLLAHFMARSTYQPHGRKRRGGLGGGLGTGTSANDLFAGLGDP